MEKTIAEEFSIGVLSKEVQDLEKALKKRDLEIARLNKLVSDMLETFEMALAVLSLLGNGNNIPLFTKIAYHRLEAEKGKMSND